MANAAHAPMEDALRRSEERLRLAKNAARLGLYDYDVRSGVIEWDERSRELCGVDAEEEITYELWRDGLHPEDRESAEASVRRALDPSGDGRHEAEYRVINRRDRSIRWVAALGQTTFENGRPVRMVGYALDITARKQAEEALRRSEAKYRSLFESIDEGFCILQMIFDEQNRPSDFRHVEVNPAFEKITGFTDALGKTARELVPGTPARLDVYGSVALSGKPLRLISHETEIDRWYDLFVFRVGEPEDRKVAIVFSDITDRRRTVLELEELNRTLEERVGKGTRQIRELAGRLTMAEQVERRRVSQILHDDLQQILVGVQIKLNVTHTDIEAGNTGEALSSLREIDTWLRSGINITRRLTVDLSPPILKGDGLTDSVQWLSRQMRELHGLSVELRAEHAFVIQDADLQIMLFQVIRELLFNVAKHARTDCAVIELAERPPGHLSIRVIDRGKGLDDRGRDVGATGVGGFGLYSIRERLGLFGGSMKVRSRDGRGTCVSIRIPISPPHAAPARRT